MGRTQGFPQTSHFSPERFQIVKRLRKSARVVDVQKIASLVVFEEPNLGNVVDPPFEFHCWYSVARGSTTSCCAVKRAESGCSISQRRRGVLAEGEPRHVATTRVDVYRQLAPAPLL
jgi:hypothetical protein